MEYKDTYPEYFEMLLRGDTKASDFVYDEKKDKYLPINENEIGLNINRFLYVIRVCPPKGYRLIDTYDYNSAGAFFKEDDLILTNFQEGFHFPDRKLLNDTFMSSIEDVIVLRKFAQG
jgi:hypothetical protein